MYKNQTIRKKINDLEIETSSFYQYWEHHRFKIYDERFQQLKLEDQIGATRFALAEPLLQYFHYNFTYHTAGIAVSVPNQANPSGTPATTHYSFTPEGAKKFDNFLSSSLDAYLKQLDPNATKAFKSEFKIAPYDQRKACNPKLSFSNYWVQEYFTLRNLRQHSYSVTSMDYGNKIRVTPPDRMRHLCSNYPELYFDYGMRGLRDLWQAVSNLELDYNRSLQGNSTKHDLTSLTGNSGDSLLA